MKVNLTETNLGIADLTNTNLIKCDLRPRCIWKDNKWIPKDKSDRMILFSLYNWTEELEK